MVSLEAAVCDGAELYCVILTDVSNILSIPFLIIMHLNQRLSKTASTKGLLY